MTGSVYWGREGGRQEGQAGPRLTPQTLCRDNSVTRVPLQGKASGHPRPPANPGPPCRLSAGFGEHSQGLTPACRGPRFAEEVWGPRATWRWKPVTAGLRLQRAQPEERQFLSDEVTLRGTLNAGGGGGRGSLPVPGA